MSNSNENSDKQKHRLGLHTFLNEEEEVLKIELSKNVNSEERIQQMKDKLKNYTDKFEEERQQYVKDKMHLLDRCSNDDHYASQQRYRIELEEQIKNNRIAKDRLKNEDIASGRAADLRSHFQHGQDNNEAEARHQKNLQYSRDLKVQIASNELRKQKNIEVESNAIWTGNNDYFSGMDEEKIELEKKQKQIETKEGLDRMIEEKAKLEQLEKDEEKRYREEMEELRNSLQKQELRSAKLEKERSLKLQQEFQESSKKIKDEIRKREVEINAAAEKEREEWFNRESNQIKHLRTAQNQLCSDVCDEWKHQIDSHKQKKENEQSQKQEDQLKSKMWNDMLYDEEEMKRQAKKEQNMQYQRDLMEQMKSDQKRKYY